MNTVSFFNTPLGYGIEPNGGEEQNLSDLQTQEYIALAQERGLVFNPEMLANKTFHNALSAILSAMQQNSPRLVDELRDIAYEYLRTNRSHYSKYITLLACAFFMQQRSPTDIASLILKELERQLTSPPVDQPSIQPQAYPTVAEARQIPPDTMLNISHGGGARYLEEWRDGKQSGYEQTGIFVSINDSSRDLGYALRNPLKWFDKPAVLQGTLEARFLEQVNPNRYEAVLPTQHLSKVQNLTIISPNILDEPGYYRTNALTQLIPACRMNADGSNDWTSLLNGTGLDEEAQARFAQGLEQLAQETRQDGGY